MYEASCFCPRSVRRRAAGADGRAARARGLCATPIPDSARQQLRGAGAPHRAATGLQRPDRAQRHRCLQPPRRGRLVPGLACHPYPPPRLRRRGRRATQGPHPSQSARLRLADQPVDAGPARRDQLRRGADQRRGHGRNRARHARPPGHQLEARQALDHQPRSPVPTKKTRRDRLMRVAERHPEWALGFSDEVWWSRVSQPSCHAWAGDQPLRLVEQTVAKTDPDPKAVAAYGVLLQGAGSLAPEGWLRFSAGRPVSALTTAFLTWCCDGLAARGKTVLLLVWDNASWHLSTAVRGWLRRHNQTGKAPGQGGRILVWSLPGQS